LINIGEFNKLKIKRKIDIGCYLDGGTEKFSDDILLPIRNIGDAELNIDELVDAFIYKDSSDRIIATLKKPVATVGELAYLKVVSTTSIGSFVDMGLEKDILVPFKEKLYPIQNGKSYLFYIYLDKTNRIAATTYVSKHLQIAPPNAHAAGDSVTGTVYDIASSTKNVKIAIDNKYKGIILKHEYFSDINYGDLLELRVTKIYDDGRIGLTPRKSAKIEVSELQEKILEYLNSHNGFMHFNDKTSPEEIYETFNVSKKYFKISLGGLMKENLITQDENGTKLI
jgi:predicted RNA-binding protein (virulence factor B family)